MLKRLLTEAHQALQLQAEASRERDGLMGQLGKRVRDLEAEVPAGHPVAPGGRSATDCSALNIS